MALLYSKEHEWVAQLDGARVRIGISDYAQQQLGDIVFAEAPAIGTALAANTSVGTIESVKAVSDIFTPVSGVVVAVNDTLEDSPEIVNEQPYEDGWLFEVELSDVSELAVLLDEAAYNELIEQGE